MPTLNGVYDDVPSFIYKAPNVETSLMSDAHLFVILSRVSPEKERNTGQLMQQKIDKDSSEKTTISDANLGHLSVEYCIRVRELLSTFLAMWDGTFGKINTFEHHIELQSGTKPICSQTYREGPKQHAVSQAEIDRMLEMGVIERAQSPWASPVVFAPKKDGTLRFCTDYRRLNSVTIRDTYPTPKMDECMD